MIGSSKNELEEFEMFFLARCAFWLGLVYLAMARDAGALEGFRDLLSHASVASAAASARAACGRAPGACLDTLPAAVAMARTAAQTGSAQTLAPADLVPPWRGRRS